MAEATKLATKEILGISAGWKLYKLSAVADGSTLTVPFGTVWAVLITPNVATTPVATSYTVSGSVITLEVASGTPNLDVIVIGE